MGVINDHSFVPQHISENLLYHLGCIWFFELLGIIYLSSKTLVHYILYMNFICSAWVKQQ